MAKRLVQSEDFRPPSDDELAAAKEMADEVTRKLRAKASKTLTGDKLIMHEAWYELGLFIDELPREYQEKIQDVRSKLFVPGKHNETTIRARK